MFFERPAFVLAGGCSHYMQSNECAKWDCMSFKLIKDISIFELCFSKVHFMDDCYDLENYYNKKKILL